jgi:4,5-DOPA dioxygenase extradiol
MFALEPGIAGPRLAALARELPRPRAIVVVSPHWMTRRPVVGASARPETIHDFGGFPEALYRLQYPAPGERAVAARAAACLHEAGWPAELDEDRGLDHGVWVPLMHMYPEANVPVVPVSLPAGLDGPGAWALGQALAPLADEGILVLGSGSLTHNLQDVFGSRKGAAERGGAGGYALAFQAWVQEVRDSGPLTRLQAIMEEAPGAHRAHPTTEHLWPLLVAAGAAREPQTSSYIEGGIDLDVLSMSSALFGQRWAPV